MNACLHQFTKRLGAAEFQRFRKILGFSVTLVARRQHSLASSGRRRDKGRITVSGRSSGNGASPPGAGWTRKQMLDGQS
jgi:hypothetical protein